VLYLTLGFRQFSHYFTDIRDALERGDETQARALLAEWRHLDASELPRTELLRHVIEHSLLAAHRHVFGVFFWFVVIATVGGGPAGAVLYRMAEFASRYWAFRSRNLEAPTNERLMRLSQRLFSAIDHIPARLTAFGFAVVGNFEEAIAGWRRDASLWKHENEGVILAAAAGAVGVQLGGAAAPGVTPDRSKTFESGALPEAVGSAGSTAGMPPVQGHLQSVVGLVWRSVVLWMMLVALLNGLALGGNFVMRPLIVANYFGRDHLGAINGIMRPLQIAGAAGGPLAVALLFDLTDNWHLAFGLVIAVWLISATSIALASKPRRRGEAEAT